MVARERRSTQMRNARIGALGASGAAPSTAMKPSEDAELLALSGTTIATEDSFQRHVLNIALILFPTKTRFAGPRNRVRTGSRPERFFTGQPKHIPYRRHELAQGRPLQMPFVACLEAPTSENCAW